MKFGINFIHEPVLSGAFPGNAETLVNFPQNPIDYLSDPGQFSNDLTDGAATIPAADGSFSQNVQRLALYAQDSWRVSSHLTVNYGLRYQTTFGLFTASGRSQLANPSLPLLAEAGSPIAAPHDYRKQFAPRLGFAYSPGSAEKTVIRAGFGMYYNDLAQGGWAPAFQAVNTGSFADPTTAPPALSIPVTKHPTLYMRRLGSNMPSANIGSRAPITLMKTANTVIAAIPFPMSLSSSLTTAPATTL